MKAQWLYIEPRRGEKGDGKEKGEAKKKGRGAERKAKSIDVVAHNKLKGGDNLHQRKASKRANIVSHKKSMNPDQARLISLSFTLADRFAIMYLLPLHCKV
ncbi:hypothetical protein E2542_SST21864 [Spatholobus suberectus]|nr:hypothetical protein E2542_SST21864 [Spatholobus suberectus]